MPFLGIMANAKIKIVIPWISKERTCDFFHLVKYAGFYQGCFLFPKQIQGTWRERTSETHFFTPTITDRFLNYQESEIRKLFLYRHYKGQFLWIIRGQKFWTHSCIGITMDSSSELSGVRNSKPNFYIGIIKDSSFELSGVRNSEPIFCMGTIKDSSSELSGVRNSEPIFCMGPYKR